MSARKPLITREPYCIHPGGEKQPASACSVCQDGPRLREWAAGWEAWLAENPDSPEARWVRAADASGRFSPVIP